MSIPSGQPGTPSPPAPPPAPAGSVPDPSRADGGTLPIPGFILAGGHSRRMGRDKALLPVGGRPLIAHIASVLRQVCAEVAVIDRSPSRYRFLGLPVITDRRPGFGPLSGLHAGLSSLSGSFGLFVACDMPGLQVDVLRYLASRALAADTARQGCEPVDAVVPCREGRPEPLLAVYHRRLLPVVEGILDQGGGSVRQLLTASGVRVHWVPEEQLRALDPSLRSLTNVNTPAQWHEWQRSAGHRP